MAEFEPVLTARWGMDAPVWIDEYERTGGYQALPDMVGDRLVADVVACIASVDPVMGGVDR